MYLCGMKLPLLCIAAVLLCACSGKTRPFSLPLGDDFREGDLVLRCGKVSRRYGLTHREEEVLELLAQGFSTQRIEETLFISSNTARTHVRHIYEKLDAHNRDDVARIVQDAK